MSSLFDPNKDRTARLIRNGLSTAFMDDMKTGSLTQVSVVVDGFSTIKSVHKRYIRERLRAYQRVVQTVTCDRMFDPVLQSLILWDEKLFFEVHECLETLWLVAEGDEKKALQSLIRAAGAFVHLGQGNIKGAKSMAQKAVDGLGLFGSNLGVMSGVFPTLFMGLAALEPPLLYELIDHE